MHKIVTPFDDIVRQLKRRHRIRVKRWRTSMTGCAWRSLYADGSSINWIESPRPVSPLSLAIFLHEVGHHVIGFDQYRLRCEEEFHAWKFAIDTMRRFGVAIDHRVQRRYEMSMQYAVHKAQRRGLKSVPSSLHTFDRLAA